MLNIVQSTTEINAEDLLDVTLYTFVRLRLFTHDSQFMAPEKRYEPANKGISEHSSMVPEPEMLNTCLNCHCHIENKGLRGF